MDNRSTDMMNDAIDLCCPVMSLFVNHLSIYSKNGRIRSTRVPNLLLRTRLTMLKEPDGTLYFYCGNTKIKMNRTFRKKMENQSAHCWKM